MGLFSSLGVVFSTPRVAFAYRLIASAPCRRKDPTFGEKKRQAQR
jgi:hypothetical protein